MLLLNFKERVSWNLLYHLLVFLSFFLSAC